MYICGLFWIFPYLFFSKSFLQIKFLILVENINKIHFFVLYFEKKKRNKQHMVQTLSGVPPLRVVIGFIQGSVVRVNLSNLTQLHDFLSVSSSVIL